MNLKAEIELKNFIVFNTLLGQIEGEEYEKILYYYPFGVDIDTQVKQVGLTEAIIQFTGNFKPDEPVNSLHTERTRQLCFEPEKNFWMVLTVNVPYVNNSKDGPESGEYLEDEVQDNVYHSVLQQSYRMFRLFSGTFQSIVAEKQFDGLKRILDFYFTPYVRCLRLNNCDILNVFRGMQYLPLDTLTFLDVQFFINQLEAEFPCISHTAFMYNEHVTWSGIEPSDMQAVYHYLVHNLLPSHKETELQGSSLSRNNPSCFFSVYYGRFLTGSESFKSSVIVENVPKVFLTYDNAEVMYHLVVYKCSNASVCLFLDVSAELTGSLFQELDEHMGPKLKALVASIGSFCSQQAQSAHSTVGESSPKFIYFNNINLAFKSTVHPDVRSGKVSVAQELLKLIADVNGGKVGLDRAGDVLLKTANDYWVVARYADSRELYIVIQQRNASLVDISDEVARLCDTELKSIFFHSA